MSATASVHTLPIRPVPIFEASILPALNAALAAQFGPDIEAIIVITPRAPVAHIPTPCELPQPTNVVRPVAERVLAMAGVPKHLQGCTYMADALVLMAADYPTQHKLCDDIYATVARPWRVGWHAVERGIRHALGVTEALHPDRYFAVLGPVLPSARRRPSVGPVLHHFLKLVADDLRQGGA